MGLKELQDVKPRPKEKQDFKLCALKLMNSYTVWNTMQEIKTLGFFQLLLLGDFPFFFFSLHNLAVRDLQKEDLHIQII